MLAERAGHAVIVASRSEPVGVRGVWSRFDLQEGVDLRIPSDVDVIVHLAANTAISSDEEAAMELLAAKRLLRLARAGRARFLFVSSQTSRVDAPTMYGRLKWRIEREVLSEGGCVVRPGQVYGGTPSGLFGVIVALVDRLSVLPAFFPAPKIQPIHVDDLCEGLLRLAHPQCFESRVYSLAAAEPMRFERFLSKIAEVRLRKRRLLVPVPALFVTLLLRLLGERLGNRTGLSRLQSLLDLPEMDARGDLEHISLLLREIESGLHPSGSGRRRALLREGRALLKYVLRVSPGIGLMARYARAVERLRGGASLGLPPLLLNTPAMLSLLGDVAWVDTRRQAEYQWRLDAATLLAEATPVGAARFLGAKRKGNVLDAVLWILYAGICEVGWRIIRVVTSPALRRFLKREARGS